MRERSQTRWVHTLRQLKPRKYEKLAYQTLEATGRQEAGFVAQDVNQIPELQFAVTAPESETTETPEGTQTNYYSLDYNSLFTYAVKAVQELDAIVQAQAVTITALQARVSALEATRKK